MCDQNRPVIIDAGSWMCKAGFASNAKPRVEFPNSIGIPPDLVHLKDGAKKDPYVGEEALLRINAF